MNKNPLSHEQIQAELDYRRAIHLVLEMKNFGLISDEEEETIEENIRQQFPPYLAEIWPKSLAIRGF